MKTPAGKECKYFYGNYFRGAHQEECRLIGGRKWTPDLCAKCAVPDILRANACEHMTLTATVQKGFLGIGRKVKVSAYCSKAHDFVDDPFLGCGQCHQLPEAFKDL
ncbi:MAG: hypothetical protein V2J07_02430 [Anaerolineae bacterium]|jgi:hypothetical protein|nr:hypothetical protein [Anaerolineae bacterium]